jgi:hypothetical protein
VLIRYTASGAGARKDSPRRHRGQGEGDAELEFYFRCNGGWVNQILREVATLSVFTYRKGLGVMSTANELAVASGEHKWQVSVEYRCKGIRTDNDNAFV